jgi:hypothetical protein
MNKEQFKKEIAQNAFYIGIDAKKHFASFNILAILPNCMLLICLAIGIIQVAYHNFLNQKELSITLIIVSVVGFFINFSFKKIHSYKIAAEELTLIYNKLRKLYISATFSENGQFKTDENKYIALLDLYNITVIKNHFFIAKWWAHYKFFYDSKIDWLDNHLHFKFWKDKVPNSLKIGFCFLLFTAIVFLIIPKPFIILWQNSMHFILKATIH